MAYNSGSANTALMIAVPQRRSLITTRGFIGSGPENDLPTVTKHSPLLSFWLLRDRREDGADEKFRCLKL